MNAIEINKSKENSRFLGVCSTDVVKQLKSTSPCIG